MREGLFDERVDAYAMEVIKILDKESDRGCVLVASAYIEDAVRRLLSAYCRTVSDVSDADLNKLFKTFDSQFANLASCIRLCRALGLMDDEDQSVLNLFGAWRNKFAHGTGDKTIEADDLKSFMSAIDDRVEIATNLVDGSTLPWFNHHPRPRLKFMVWAAIFVAALHDCLLELEDAKKPPHSPDAKAE